MLNNSLCQFVYPSYGCFYPCLYLYFVFIYGGLPRYDCFWSSYIYKEAAMPNFMEDFTRDPFTLSKRIQLLYLQIYIFSDPPKVDLSLTSVRGRAGEAMVLTCVASGILINYFPAELLNWLLSAVSKPVLSHSEKSCIYTVLLLYPIFYEYKNVRS